MSAPGAAPAVLALPAAHSPRSLGPASPTQPAPTPSPTAAAISLPLCPVTRPGQVPLPPDVAAAVRDGQIFGSGAQGELMHGSGALWASGLPTDGVAVIAPQDGELGLKLGWWRRRPGTAQIEGRRLDAPAPPLRASLDPAPGAGLLPSGLVFPTEGCWEIVASLDGEELRFVLRVVQGSTEPGDALDRFMQARLARDDQQMLALLTSDLREKLRSGAVAVPLGQVSNPCWYRYELLSLDQPAPDSAQARVRVYEHFWPGDVAGGIPQSWEQTVHLAGLPFPGWLVDELGAEEGRRPEPNEPHGPTLSACRVARTAG